MPVPAMMASSSRATREPDSEVSTTSKAFAREVVDDRQDADALTADQRVADEVEAHRWFGPCGSVMGTRAPIARFRPRRRLTRRFSS